MVVENAKIDTKNKLNQIDGILRNCGISSVKQKQEFQIISDPIETYKIFMNSIKNAKKSIYISTYVFKYDKTTKEILDALEKKAQEGVKIKLLIDSLGSWQLYFKRYPLKKLIRAGGEVEFFMPALKMPFRNYINLRNHRKIYMFDEEIVLSGGMNLANEYLGEDKTIQRWKDILFITRGSSVNDFF